MSTNPNPEATSLSAEDINKATLDAHMLEQQDVDHQSALAAAEELGVPPEYIARAVNELKLQEDANKRRRESVKLAGLAAICVVAVIVSVFLVSEWSSESLRNASASGAITPDYTQRPLQYHPPLGIVAANLGIPLKLTSTYSWMVASQVTIVNHTSSQVNVNLVMPDSSLKWAAKVAPGQHEIQFASFGTPLAITNATRKTIGFVFPSGANTNVDIPANGTVDLDESAKQGYLTPLSNSDNSQVDPVGRFQDTHTAFVNLSHQTVRLYWTEHMQVPEPALAHTLLPGQNWTTIDNMANTWIVRGENGQVVERFRPSITPNTALITDDGINR